MKRLKKRLLSICMVTTLSVGLFNPVMTSAKENDLNIAISTDSIDAATETVEPIEAETTTAEVVETTETEMTTAEVAETTEAETTTAEVVETTEAETITTEVVETTEAETITTEVVETTEAETTTAEVAETTDAELDNIFDDEAKLIAAANAEHNETISYYVHQQNYGDTTPVGAGEVAGNTGTNKRLEAFSVVRTSADTSEVSGDIVYSAHCQNVGWIENISNGQKAGTTGLGRRMEAIKINLTGELAEKYDIYYKTYMSNFGWLDWTRNGAISGTVGYGATIEGIQILLVLKESENAPIMGRYSSITADNMNDIMYSGHVQTYGDLSEVMNGRMLGTTGRAKRLEAIKIRVSHGADEIYGTVKYNVHCQKYGWMEEVTENKLAGTTGEAKRLEAISISLSGDLATYCDVYYRTHCQNFGWLGWAKNGENSGSAGYGRRVEAIEIIILPKGSAAPVSKVKAFYDAYNIEVTNGYAQLEPYLDRIIAQYTNSSMTKEQKLKALYDYSRTHFEYKTLSNDCPPGFLFHEYYAYQLATTGKGNCYGVNFLFGHLAKKIGYTDVKFIKGSVLAVRSPHGWVEIDGLIYDPELHWKNGRSFYGVKNYQVFAYYYD